MGLVYRALLHGPAQIMLPLDRGEPVVALQYYFRTAIMFETASATYDWLNRIFAIGTGSRPPEGPVYEIYEVL
jgi:hypothetical protein